MTTIRTYYNTVYEDDHKTVQSQISHKDVQVNTKGLLAVLLHNESMIKNGGFVRDNDSAAFVPYHAVLLIVALEDE